MEHAVKILQVIHGYPMRYNAGSEVYTQTLSQGLAEQHEVQVFTRMEDPFLPDYEVRLERDPSDSRIPIHLVNNPRNRDRYRCDAIDARFAEVLESFRPDIVHVNHTSHLSTSLIQEATRREIPVIYTLHDFWLLCPRGQFMQTFSEDPGELWGLCPGQVDENCALRCYRRYFGGGEEDWDLDRAYWTGWVKRRQAHLRGMLDQVDRFIAPSRQLLERYRNGFAIPDNKLVYLDYGFDRRRLEGRKRTPDPLFTFGYIGTHIPSKGIHHLIDAFSRLRGNARLRIWGRPRGLETRSLKALADRLLGADTHSIEWLPEYRNEEIVHQVFDRVDAIVTPSIWLENSPLVIHEAQAARIPVITANAGGMAEYVRHEWNGLLFAHRSPASLTTQMQRLLDAPELAAELGKRGYLHSKDGRVPCIHDHVRQVEGIYESVLRRRDQMRPNHAPGPWRITFDTNPDTCNLGCRMCEEHAPSSPRRSRRRDENLPPRVMPLELIRRIVAEAAPLGLKEIIPSTMGEPLLYEHFDEILQLCHEHGLFLNLTTNGSFPRRSAEDWARRIVPVTSDVKISWNGATRATQESIMPGSPWERRLSDLQSFVKVRDEHATEGPHRCRLTFQLTFMEANLEELPEIVRLARRLGIDRVKGHHLWVHFPELERQSLRRDADAIRRWNDTLRAVRAAAAEAPLANGQPVLLENFDRLDPSNAGELLPDGLCPFLGQEAWVSAEGKFSPCCAPDDLRRSLGNFGNLQRKSLREIWHDGAYRSLLQSYRNRSLCIGCAMRRRRKESS